MTPSGVRLDSILICEDSLIQSAPFVSYGNGVYLVSWSDERNILYPDIYYARVLPNGTVLDLGGIPLFPDSGQQLQVVSAFDGSNFFVVWTEYINTGFGIYGARISPDGTLLDSVPITLSPLSASKFPPALSFDGSNYMVLWDDMRLLPPEYDEWATRISPEGTVLDSNGFVVDTSPGYQMYPSLTFLDPCYFALWEDRGSGVSDIVGKRISPVGYIIDTNPVPVCTVAGTQRQPCVFRDTEKFLCTWSDERMGSLNSDIYATFIDTCAGIVENEEYPVKNPLRFLITAEPNPFSSTTTITVSSISDYQYIRESELHIYDVSGRKVREISLLPFSFSLGARATWDGTDSEGKTVSGGIYFCVFNKGKRCVRKKLIIVR